MMLVERIWRLFWWPSYRIADWVMESYDGYFPETTRRVQMIKGVALQIGMMTFVILGILILFGRA